MSQNTLGNLPFFEENITDEFSPDESPDPPIEELGDNDINTDYNILKKWDYILKPDIFGSVTVSVESDGRIRTHEVNPMNANS